MNRNAMIFTPDLIEQRRRLFEQEEEYLPDETLVMDLKQAAKFSGLPYWTLYRLVESGDLATVKLPGKITKGTSRRIWVTKEALVALIKRYER